tara:strand:+ start:4395 stop:5423 length:1029 start_codon:yes stop_codon:yes gene_type:complete
MRVSIIIPVYNPGAIFQECLLGISNSGIQPIEIIIVDDCSEPKILPKELSIPVKIFRSEIPVGPGVARNIGAENARGDILMFIDSDVIIEGDTIDRIVRRFEGDSKLVGVSGFYNYNNRFNNPSTIYHNLYFEYKQKHISPESPYVDTAIWGIRKDIFNATGGFTKGMFTSEDLEYGIRLYRDGYKLCSDVDIKVSHVKKLTFNSWIKNRFCSCVNMVMAKMKKPSHKNEKKERGGSVQVLHTIHLNQIFSPFLSLSLFFLAGIVILSKNSIAVAIFSLTITAYIIINLPYLNFIFSRCGLTSVLIIPFVLLEHLISLAAISIAIIRMLLGFPSLTYRGTKK